MATDKPKIPVSIATFHELAAALEKMGIKTSDAKTLIIEKGSDLQPPIDWRLVTVRKDCAEIITKLFEFYPDGTSVPVAIEELFQYIVHHKLPEKIEPELETNIPTKGEWK